MEESLHSAVQGARLGWNRARARIQVETYSGYKADERPVAFRVGQDRKVVVNVIDQWASEAHTYFKVLADDRRVYLVRYDRRGDF